MGVEANPEFKLNHSVMHARKIGSEMGPDDKDRTVDDYLLDPAELAHRTRTLPVDASTETQTQDNVSTPLGEKRTIDDMISDYSGGTPLGKKRTINDMMSD